MSDPLTTDPSLGAIAGVALATLAVLYGFGWVLVPRHVRSGGGKLFGLACVLTSGLLFVSGLSATLTLQRFNYLTLVPSIQLLAALVWHWQARRCGPMLDQPGERWSWRDLAVLAGVVVACCSLYHVTSQRSFADGSVRELHADLGYFVQQVLALPEARVANLWGPTLGTHASAATAGHDLWYHWGSIFLAVAIKAVSGLPAMPALLDVARLVLNAILLMVASAVLGTLVKLPLWKLLLLGAVSITATQLMKIPAALEWMNAHLPYGHFQHSKVSLAQFFAYKFEGIVVLMALAAWLNRKTVLAVVLLLGAGISAPHTVAACGVAAGALGAVGIVLRKPPMWRTAAVMTVTLLAAWSATLWLGGAEMAGSGGQGNGLLNFADLPAMAGRGTVDFLISLVMSALSLPGIFFLIASKDPQASEESRILGWLALCGIAGSSLAFQLLHHMPDAFHVMLFVQTILVMPVGVWGLARIAAVSPGAGRSVALALMTAGTLMGVHDLIVPSVSRIKTVWRSGDLAAVQQVLQGRPFGYYASADRGWWIPKYSFLGGMLDSRCVRLNAAAEEQKIAASHYYGYTKPFQILPPASKENEWDWSLRFADQLGIEYLIETWDDRLPKAIQARSQLVLSVAGHRLRVYRLKAVAGEGEQGVAAGAGGAE